MTTPRPIVLATFNARWTHTSLGLRSVAANLGPLRPRALIVELDLEERPVDAVERILALDPLLVGLGVFIWNVRQSTELVRLLKRLRADLPVVLGGPEVSFALDDLPVVDLADWVIRGEAEVAFRQLCAEVEAGRRPQGRILDAPPPDLASLELPYDLYDQADFGHRAVYVEASRGCPFGCEFCLASRSQNVRTVPPERLLTALARLWQRGLRQYRFTDRSLHLGVGPQLLRFFLERAGDSLFLHLELIPDRLPERLRPLLAAFPAGALQLEVGVQTFDAAVAARVGRHHDLGRVEATLRFLRTNTGAHVHADLLVGLPGEGLAGFAAGFDRLLGLAPHEVQVGLLKRLRGAPIARHDAEWGMVWSPDPPYEVLATRDLDFATVQRLRRFARVVDLVLNSGRFSLTAPLLWGDGSPFAGLLAFSDWLLATAGQTHAIALHRLARLLFAFLTRVRGLAPERAAAALAADYRRLGREPIPLELRERPPRTRPTPLPPRQRRHAPRAQE